MPSASKPAAKGALRLLLAWELGANLGHVKPLLAIGEVLAQQGADIALAARHLGSLEALRFDGLSVFQAPVWPAYNSFANEQARTGYGDLLAAIGFAEPALLEMMVTAWESLLDLWQPDLVIYDHSPALATALFGRRTARLAVGSAYTSPPLHQNRLVQFRADLAPAMPEDRLLASPLAVLRKRGVRLPPHLPALFRNPQLVFSLPEIDPYQSLRREQLYLPPEGLPLNTAAPLEPHLFVYVGNDLPTLAPIAEALGGLNVKISAYLREISGPMPAFLKARGVTLYETPPNLRLLLPQVSHVFSQGGAYLCQAALAAGRPHLIAPLHAETVLNHIAMARLNAAWRLESVEDARLVADTLRSFLRDPWLPRHAQDAARIVANRQLPDGLAAVEDFVAQFRKSRAKKDTGDELADPGSASDADAPSGASDPSSPLP